MSIRVGVWPRSSPTHTSLEKALNWGRTQSPPVAVEAILTQDEYTHDVLIPFENRYLVYDTT